MTVKSIVVPFLEKQSATEAFAAASAVGKAMKAHLLGVHMRQRPAPPTVAYYPLGGGYPPVDAPSFLEAEEAHASEMKALFQASCEAAGVEIAEIDQHKDEKGASASWSDLKGDMPEDLARFAGVYDLAVLSPPDGPFAGALAHAAEALLFRSGRPLLVSPAGEKTSLSGHILIAWNGRAEAARAVGASLELLKNAARVSILCLREHDAAGVEPEPLAAALRLHGVDAASIDLDLAKGERAIDAFEHQLDEQAPDLVVMGAYSHSRWREAVLGGFTRRMLMSPKAPVLMAR